MKLQYCAQALACLVGAVLLAACSTAGTRSFSQTQAPQPKNMAVINGLKMGDHTFFDGLNHTVLITSLDGKSLFNPFHVTGYDYPTSVNVAPGKHRVVLRYFHDGKYALAPLWLVAEAGKSYSARFVGTQKYVSLYFVDDKNGKPTGGIQGSDDEPGKPSE